MKKIIQTLIALTFSLKMTAQDNLIIKGKIERLSKSTEIIISGSDGQFKSKINEDGSFIITAKITDPSVALIRTDSSGANAIWLEPGEYTITCREIRLDSLSGYYFRTPELKGPRNSEIYHGFQEPQYYQGGKSKEETAANYKRFYTNYIDSIFRIYPSSITIPEMLRMSRSSLGDEKLKQYLSLLNDEQKKSGNITQINAHFSRQEKIDKEKYFRDFKMKDQNGKLFKLASLDKKLIFVDFWSSDCMPCRAKHPKLAELYKKYADKGFEILSISLDDTDNDWKKAIAKDNMTWINVSELKGWETSIAEYYSIKYIPFGFWLDKDKKIITTESLSEKQMEEYLK